MHSTRSTSRNGGLLLRGRRRGGLLYKGEEEGERPTYKGEGREEKTEKEKKGIPPPKVKANRINTGEYVPVFAAREHG